MITAYNFQKAQKVIEEAQSIVKSEMPNAQFVLVGVDNDFVYFNVVAKLSQITHGQVIDIEQKTRFHTIAVTTKPIYKGEFKIRINL